MASAVFRSKRGDRLKILVWDGTGMVLIYKVLEQLALSWLLNRLWCGESR